MLTQLQQIVAQANSTNGSIGKLLNSDELYNKANLAVDNLNKTIDQINSGQGTIGKFIKDPALYDNANQTMAKANQLLGDINAGKGTLGKLAKDEETGQEDRQHDHAAELHPRPDRQRRRNRGQADGRSLALQQRRQDAGGDART